MKFFPIFEKLIVWTRNVYHSAGKWKANELHKKFCHEGGRNFRDLVRKFEFSCNIHSLSSDWG